MSLYYEGPESCKNPKDTWYTLGFILLDNKKEIYNKLKDFGY